MYILYILITYLLIDFIYKKIILPSIRQQYRDKLFQIRDKVRARIIDDKLSQVDLSAANLMNSNLNSFINRLHLLNLNNRIRAKIFMRKHPDIARKIESDTKRELDLLMSCSDRDIRDSFIEMMDILQETYIVNNFIIILMWLPVFIPGIILYYLYKAITRPIKGIWKNLSDDIKSYSMKIEKLDVQYGKML
ncbi:hypothetical protein [Pasteurella multocida]|uniref:hypothetical protein n=1 Tax=Pasteurella multocida TaxID=747 RepID=UPI000F6DEC21|nr:hypothetical protein [Pasteurella multocida]VEJ14427.1 Uncharacterised protein [Pasteurella multocida subsp. septica]HEA3247851.1 hypothetical protein [Pasteurella multocida]